MIITVMDLTRYEITTKVTYLQLGSYTFYIEPTNILSQLISSLTTDFVIQWVHFMTQIAQIF